MKLNKDLVRKILLAVEESDHDPRTFMGLTIDGEDQKHVAYHVMLMDEAGLIEAVDVGSMSTFDYRPVRLTYQGHEFLDAIRDKEIWRKTKSAAETAGNASIAFLWEIAKAEVKVRLGLP